MGDWFIDRRDRRPILVPDIASGYATLNEYQSRGLTPGMRIRILDYSDREGEGVVCQPLNSRTSVVTYGPVVSQRN